MPEEQFGMILGRGLLGAEEELVQERELREVVVVEEEEEEEEEVGSCCSSWQDGRSNAVRLGVRAP